jgi:hypothetical protein
MDPSQYNGQFHRASEASPGVLLLEFNRCVHKQVGRHGHAKKYLDDHCHDNC